MGWWGELVGGWIGIGVGMWVRMCTYTVFDDLIRERQLFEEESDFWGICTRKAPEPEGLKGRHIAVLLASRKSTRVCSCCGP